MTRRRPKQAITMALFPFLAVLVCTMGCLIVLLVVQLLNARAEANTIAESPPSDPIVVSNEAEIKARAEEREGLEWKLSVLAQQREDSASKLAERRMQLGHLEDHIGRLQKRLDELRGEVGILQDAAKSGRFDREAAAAILGELRDQIATTESQLAESRKKNQTRKRSFAVVPYDGPNGTVRRPIYVECLPDAIILRPEGIRLSGDDFKGPLDLGNPLDAALRVTREYWVRSGESGKGEPYPLLLVRPGGAESYAAARAAMQSWDSEFGYELLDANLDLAFPPPDQSLAELLERTVSDARKRQKTLIAAAPALYGRGTSESRSRGSVGFRSVENNSPGDSESSGTSAATRSFGSDGRNSGAANPNAGAANAGPSGAGGQPGGSQGAPTSGVSGTPLGVASVSKSRGKNWALPNGGAGIPITRPIRVACYADRLVLIPERGDRAYPTEIPLAKDVRAGVEQLSTNLAQRMEGWGLAGPGMYWKPQLKIQVLPGGETMYETVFHLLEGSGLILERVQ